MKVLVAYATAHGSTRGIAERIAERLRESGLHIDLRDLGEGYLPGQYDAFVLGSAIHNGKWLAEATRAIESAADALRRRPAWLFSVSTIGEESSGLGRLPSWAARKLRPEPRHVTDFRRLFDVRGHHAFAGVVTRGDWGRFGNVFLHAMGGRFGDLRNWQEVDRWAAAIAEGLSLLDTGPAPGPAR